LKTHAKMLLKAASGVNAEIIFVFTRNVVILTF
jgi:hypothetical protein